MDVFGVTYLIENAQQFWSELEDIVHIPSDVTLSQLDAALRRFIFLSAAYHEHYLQSPLQMEHACNLLLDSELFKFHSERMSEILVDDSRTNTDPHGQFILFNVLLTYGQRNISFLRSHKRWQPLIPLFMDHVLIDIDPDMEDTYTGSTGPSGSRTIIIPIEVKLRSLSVRLLYEVCRVQKLSVQDLRVFDDGFIERLFDLVEETRNMQDDTFNYSVIKLIVALNEQFMVASIQHNPDKSHAHGAAKPELQNRVLRVLMRRLHSCMTFGENMIFMLNRAGRTPEDRCMQLLVLKILYLLFTTKGTSEYFYTNDLCVLVDVFLRELVDLDEDNESLRHTFLRVLNPLLTKTQLRTIPYKRPQIVRTLESLVENADIRDVNPTTKRLVDRCLSGEWCVQFRMGSGDSDARARPGVSPSNDNVAAATITATAMHTTHSGSLATSHGEKERAKGKTLKTSRSVENMKGAGSTPLPHTLQNLRRPSNESSLSLPSTATAKPLLAASKRRDTAASYESSSPSTPSDSSGREYIHREPHRADSLGAVEGHSSSPLYSASFPTLNDIASTLPPDAKKMLADSGHHHRSAPPTPPPRRRKPPAVPVSRSNGGVTITTIASSTSQPALTKTRRAVAEQRI